METPFRLFFTTCRSCLRLSRHRMPRAYPPVAVPSLRSISSAKALRQDADTEAADRPRWQRTPPAMSMPVRARPKPKGPEYQVNDDPRKLDQVYSNILGTRNCSEQLSDEVKWLAVTHKSFDHGRRGFNDRLAFLGMSTTTGPHHRKWHTLIYRRDQSFHRNRKHTTALAEPSSTILHWKDLKILQITPKLRRWIRKDWHDLLSNTTYST